MAFHPGVTDSIEQHIVKVNEPGGPLGLGIELNDVEYANQHWKGGVQKLEWFGMKAGIAMKPGNAGGVKAFTVFARGWTNICYTQR
jgi:hypothetical protein